LNSILAYLFIFIVLVAIVSLILAHQRHQNWRQFARKYRFRFRQQAWLRKPIVEGQIQGRHFRLMKAETSSDTGVMGVELIEMTMGLLGRIPAGLLVSKEAPSLAPDQESRRIETGDEKLDQAAYIEGRNPPDVLHYLTTDRRQALLELLSFESADFAGIREDRVVLTERRMVSDLTNLERRFQFLFDVARRLDG
jgi:hypothetical protein